MKQKILEFLQDIYNEEVYEYLNENCVLQENQEPYGDTFGINDSDYSSDDQVEAECYVMDRLEESIENALIDLKKIEGF